MHFDLVSPERRLASMEIDSVGVPGSEGNMTIMPEHASILTSLCPGILYTLNESGSNDYIVTGGIAEITADSVVILAEQAYQREEMTSEIMAEIINSAEYQVEVSEKAQHDVASMHLERARTLGSELGL